MIFHPPNTFNSSNNKYKLSETQLLIDQDNLEGPFWFTGGTSNYYTQDEFITYATGKDATRWCSVNKSLTLYDALLTPTQDDNWEIWCSGNIYWNMVMTDYWDTTMTDYWDIPMDTVVT